MKRKFVWRKCLKYFRWLLKVSFLKHKQFIHSAGKGIHLHDIKVISSWNFNKNVMIYLNIVEMWYKPWCEWKWIVVFGKWYLRTSICMQGIWCVSYVQKLFICLIVAARMRKQRQWIIAILNHIFYCYLLRKSDRVFVNFSFIGNVIYY